MTAVSFIVGSLKAIERSNATEETTRGAPGESRRRNFHRTSPRRLCACFSIPERISCWLCGGQTPLLGYSWSAAGNCHWRLCGTELSSAQHRADSKGLFQQRKKGTKIIICSPHGYLWQNMLEKLMVLDITDHMTDQTSQVDTME